MPLEEKGGHHQRIEVAGGPPNAIRRRPAALASRPMQDTPSPRARTVLVLAARLGEGHYGNRTAKHTRPPTEGPAVSGPGRLSPGCVALVNVSLGPSGLRISSRRAASCAGENGAVRRPRQWARRVRPSTSGGGKSKR